MEVKSVDKTEVGMAPSTALRTMESGTRLGLSLAVSRKMATASHGTVYMSKVSKER